MLLGYNFHGRFYRIPLISDVIILNLAILTLPFFIRFMTLSCHITIIFLADLKLQMCVYQFELFITCKVQEILEYKLTRQSVLC